jgi:anti-sigma regulatory factor (Ser/Thr protein kinase)
VHAERSLPAEAGSARAARHFVTRTLRDWDIANVEDSVVLLVSELVTNAVLHARSALVLLLDRTDTHLRVAVRDRSPVLPQQRRYRLDAATGRGLGLVDLMSSDWGVVAESDGKEIWFTVPVTGEPAPEPTWTEFDIDAVEAL